MPELPEVEVIRRTLAPRVEGRRILAVEAHREDLRETLDLDSLRACVGEVLAPPGRRGKYLLFPTEGEPLIAIHLGMTGRLTVVPEDAPQEPHEHVAWRLDRGERLRFVDPRRFGLVLALHRSRWQEDRHFAHLGLEPLEEAWGGGALRARARGRRAPVKNFLMDSRVVVGVGNIYASEALHRAGIHPARTVDRIGEGRWDSLARAVAEVLAASIEHGGTTLRDFVDGTGESGDNRIRLAVYDREGEPCPRCGTRIRRRVQAGRSTFYCAGCQR